MKQRKSNTGAAAARDRMIARQLRTDSAANVPPEINASLDMDRFLHEQKENGLLCLCEDSALKEQLYEAAKLPWAVFGDRLAAHNMTGLFLFDSDAQDGDYYRCGGITQMYMTDRGVWGYKVGITTDTVKSGMEYCTFVILHELCHVINWTLFGHEVHWHGALDEMLAEFNRATGWELRNDYDQLYQ